MRFSYRYPALVRARPRPGTGLRNVVTALSDEVDVPELTEAEAPLACSLVWRNRPYRYRTAGERLFLDLGPVVDVSDAVVPLPAQAQASIVGRLFSLMARDTLGRRRTLYPHRAEYAARKSLMASSVGACAAEPFGLPYDLGPDGVDYNYVDVEGCQIVDPAAVEIWRDHARERALDSFVLGGRFWTEVREPVFLTKLTSGDVLLDDVSIYEAGRQEFRTGRRELRHVDYSSWEHSVYALSTVKERLSLPSERHPAADAVDNDGWMAGVEAFFLPQPERFGGGGPALELVRQARLAVSLRRIFLLDGRRWSTFSDRAMRRSYGILETLLARSRDIDDVPDGLDDALEAFAVSWERQVGSDWASVIQKSAEFEMFRAVENWRARPISLVETAREASWDVASSRQSPELPGLEPPPPPDEQVPGSVVVVVL